MPLGEEGEKRCLLESHSCAWQLHKLCWCFHKAPLSSYVFQLATKRQKSGKDRAHVLP